jgi:predicted DNA-binding transcriptional regulator YafY
LEFVAGLPKYPATLRAFPAIIPRLRFAGRFSRVENIDAPGADGWSKVTVRFETLEEASEYALGFGPDLEVLEPEELRERVVRRARETAEFYAERDSVGLGSTVIVGNAIPHV